MLKVLQHIEQRQIIENQGVRFLVISSLAHYDQASVASADALILNEMDERDAKQILSEIRRQQDKNLYLKPVFSTFNSPYVSLGLDGHTDMVSNDQISKRVHLIKSRIAEVNTTVIPHDFEKQNLFKFLAFLFSRESSIIPQASRDAKIGYVYPFLDSLYMKSDPLNLINILKQGSNLGLTTQKLVDKVHGCNDCHSNYLNFREVCPKCKSVDLEAKDLVHHFKCAHVDVIDKFRDGEGLTCPKCEQKLRHIGIDYDKPSTMNHCHDCHHEFQESDMIAFCFDCGREEEPQNLIEIQINSYALTDKGEDIVQNGWQIGRSNETLSTQQVVSFDLFRMMIKLEIQRAKVGGSSVLAEIQVSDQIVKLFGADGRELFQSEMTGIIQPYLEESDLLSAKSSGSFYVLFVGLTDEEAKQKVSLVEHNLTKLICDNLEGEQELVLAKCQTITPELKIDELL